MTNSAEFEELEQRVRTLEGHVDALSLVLQSTIFAVGAGREDLAANLADMIANHASSHGSGLTSSILREWNNAVKQGKNMTST